MLEEAAALPALGATDQLPPADGELERSRAPEAECGRPVGSTPDEGRDLDATPSRPSPAPSPGRARGRSRARRRRPESPLPGHHAVGDLPLRRLVENGAAAGRPPHESDAQRGAPRAVHGVVEKPARSRGDGGGLPAVEPDRGPLVPRIRPRRSASSSAMFVAPSRGSVTRRRQVGPMTGGQAR